MLNRAGWSMLLLEMAFSASILIGEQELEDLSRQNSAATPSSPFLSRAASLKASSRESPRTAMRYSPNTPEPPVLCGARTKRKRTDKDRQPDALPSPSSSVPSHFPPSLLLLRSMNRPGAQSRLVRLGERLACTSPRATLTSVALPAQAKCTIALAAPNDASFSVISTHGGDHTVKVSSLSTMQVTHTLSRHWRTPWTVAVHPLDPRLMASGCLDGLVCVWRNYQLLAEVQLGEETIVMSLAFRGGGNRDDEEQEDELFIAAKNDVYAWRFRSGPSAVRKVLSRQERIPFIALTSPFKFGSLVLAEVECSEGLTQLSKVSLWPSTALDEAPVTSSSPPPPSPQIVVSRVVCYSDGGLGLSRCGRFLCGVRLLNLSSWNRHELVVVSVQPGSAGQVLRSMVLSGRSLGLTSVKFSPTDEHIVCGFGVKGRECAPGSNKLRHCLYVFSNYAEDGSALRPVQKTLSEHDDVNVAIFHPQPGAGILYGTREGPLRLFSA